MPALTHGRVKNGFNLIPRQIVKVNKIEKCDGCTENCIITKPICKTNTAYSNNTRVNHYSKSSKKKSKSLGTVGMSNSAKRAIMRRTEKKCNNNCK